ncbi:MAG: lipoyl(octanoyl) transferase [Anaerolineales bacterium]|nr:lipoyl(octanoyl) transferase [Anaerolineales bacterium]
MAAQCIVYRLGSIPYERAWKLQADLAAQIAAGERPPALLLLEHPHTYTFGRRGRAENLLWDEAELARRGVTVLWVDRGGDVTYHGPGQLVGYPLLPIAPGGLQASAKDNGSSRPRLPQADYVGYIRKLEETLVLALMRLGVASGQIEGLTGVWVQPHALSRCVNCKADLRQPPAKIAAIGVKVDVKGVSQHGFALNVDTDMSYWDGINGCGLKDYRIASLAGILQPAPSMQEVTDVVIDAFGEVFAYDTKENTPEMIKALLDEDEKR